MLDANNIKCLTRLSRRNRRSYDLPVKVRTLIVVMDAGTVGEEGTHEALLARGGLYAELYRTQILAAAPPTALSEVAS